MSHMKLPIYLIESADRRVLAETFMRFQEHYESPVFGGKIFTFDDFAAWYTSKHGSFSYAQDWSGFNIPSRVLKPFKNGDFGSLTSEEQRLMDIFKYEEGDFYIIGATPQDEWWADTVRHEFVHGAFFINKDYRDAVDKFIQGQNAEAIKKALTLMGYSKDVLNDETNAYLLTEPQTLGYYVSLGDGFRLRDKLDLIFKKFFGFSMVNVPLGTLMPRVKHFSL
jgi:hypothetical protein